MLDALLGLERIYNGFDAAADELTKELGIPLCVEGCGKCCLTPTTYRIEGIFAVSASLGDGKIDIVADCAESWLLDHHKVAPTYEGPQFGSLKPEMKVELRVLSSTPCPFLLSDKTCLIYRGRPMVCRAYSVTHMPGPTLDFCHRLLGKGETETHRAYIDNPQLEKMVRDYFNSLEDPDWKVSGLLPTVIFKQIHPKKYEGYIADNRIASAKLVGLPQEYLGMLWQEQMNREYRQAPVHIPR